ncbi:uncharacterized protein BP5553_03598 [Venustampulla echinocandica]|uniref:ERT1/acuK family PAS domain-containing protein n=1 Tax=Venustampulla echinocandica TaxID=2656787 RepID=A0A370TUV4_9HELO|nr:uncharacterized protein BP5553_03598 [Venustampulla echinocandica]RDL39258.1 hypothetical protein BP5553_03598 [Venustampulla echinocandica]
MQQMAPGPDTLKRKRSRPSEWWTATPPTSVKQHPLEQQTEQRPEERGGSSPVEHTGEEHFPEQSPKNANASKTLQSTQRETSKRRRSRPSDWWAVDSSVSFQENEPTAKKRISPNTIDPKRAIKEIPSASNRGKPVDQNVIAEIDENANTEVKPLKRKAKSDSVAQSRDQEQSAGSSILPTAKKRGRPPTRQSKQEGTDEIISAPDRNGTKKQRGRDRKQQARVGEVLDVQTASSAFGSTRPQVGRVVKSSKHGSSQPPNLKKRNGPSSSAVSKQSAENPKALDKANELRDTKRRRVREASQEEEDGGQVPEVPLRYQHLAAVTRRVPRQTIEAKWEALNPSCIEHISQLLADIQKPAAVRFKDEHRRTQASTVLQMVSRRLVSKISKGIPFPPGTSRQREDDFNFEKIINRNRVLDSQLTAAIDGNKLLDASLSNEMALLESETAALSKLETNAKAEARKRKQGERKLHPLLQPDGSATEDGMDDAGIVSTSVRPTLGILEDENMQAVVQKLEGHVDSMGGNLEQVHGITEAMAKTKAAVQVIIFDHLDRSDAMEQNAASNGQDTKPETSSPAAATAKAGKRRRKVNHACVYCRRSERPCARCIKRNIGHLCHDEPREPETATKKAKKQNSNSTAEENSTAADQRQGNIEGGMSNSVELPQEQSQDNNSLTSGTATLSQGRPLQLVQPSPVSGIQTNALNSNSTQFLGYSNDWLGTQSQFQDMHNYHPSYMFNAPEVTTEYNLLNDFLNNSLLDEGALLPDDTSNLYADQAGNMLPGGLSNTSGLHHSGPVGPGNPQSSGISRPASTIPIDKAREYYLQAADPTGNDAPEERMQRLLRAKYDAGMLKPFNYVKGYARLSAYMDGHMHAASKQKILRQLDRFRPKFREKIQALTDIELIYVEMWFERSLMEYDRVFASMAIPACLWRRTGEIFRGNKEMAELIHVPIDKLRDGKIALHDILTEESLVNYWEKFGAIAFDQSQKALLTSCSLKNPDDPLTTIKCCFSFTIRRDDHKIPSLIVGNFLPQDPVKR